MIHPSPRQISLPWHAQPLWPRFGRGAFAGNSSAGIKETPATGCPVVNIGPRAAWSTSSGQRPGRRTMRLRRDRGGHSPGRRRPTTCSGAVCRAGSDPYGSGDAGPRIAEVLSAVTPGRESCCRSGSPTDMKARRPAKTYARERTPLRDGHPSGDPVLGRDRRVQRLQLQVLVLLPSRRDGGPAVGYRAGAHGDAALREDRRRPAAFPDKVKKVTALRVR